MLKRKIASILCLVFTMGVVQAQDANILVSLNSPGYGVKIKNNFPNYNGGYARAFMLSNQDASADLIGLGAWGNVVNGVSTLTYGYIGQNSANPMLTFLPNGNVGVGTKDPKNYKLAVAGNMIAESVKIQLVANWADFVFYKDYKLPSLEETEKHIKENGHLPGIPSASDVKSSGIDVAEMNSKLLQKIEELTLYLIDQKKELERLKADNLEIKKVVFKRRR